MKKGPSKEESDDLYAALTERQIDLRARGPPQITVIPSSRAATKSGVDLKTKSAAIMRIRLESCTKPVEE